MNAPVFWSERVSAILKTGTLDERLCDLAAVIQDALAARDEGRGPPQDDLRLAISAWNGLYEQWVAERLPSTTRKDAA